MNTAAIGSPSVQYILGLVGLQLRVSSKNWYTAVMAVQLAIQTTFTDTIYVSQIDCFMIFFFIFCYLHIKVQYYIYLYKLHSQYQKMIQITG